MMGQTNRRQFLAAAAATAGVGFYAGNSALAQETKKERSPIERLKIACIGVGGKGSSDTSHAGKFGDVVALCDVDADFLESKAKSFPKASKFSDFRILLDKLGKDIDAVVVSTPDHTHAVAAAMAMRMGKHVYCQKPLTHSVHEARRLRELAREFKVCTQMGNQGTASAQFRTSVEFLRSPALGGIKEVHLWTNRPVWPQSPGIRERPKEEAVPKYLAWDLWLGPAPLRPYAHGRVDPKRPHRGHYHDFNWRGWWDFGTGALGDMACHTANMPYMGLRLGLPTTISAESEKLNNETYPGWARVEYEFVVASQKAPIKVIWYEGRRDGKRVLPSLDLIPGEKDYSGSGSLVVGEKVTVYSPDDYGRTRRLFGANAKDIKMPDATLPRMKGDDDENQKGEWIEAIKKNDFRLALSNFDHASLLTEAILLGNVAMKAGKKLEYDGAKGAFKNDSEANKLLQREYRTGWRL